MAPCLRSVTTQAPSRSARAMRGCQNSLLREPRPNMITGRSARVRSAAAAATALLRRTRRLGRHEARQVGPFRHLVEARLLEAGVEADIDRRGRRAAGGEIGAAHGFHQRLRRGRLVVPLDEGADQRALVARGMNPVDPGPALLGIDRTGGAEHDHRHAVAPGVEQAHHAVQQPDIAVQHAGHRLAGRLGVAVRDRDRVILVQAQQDARPLVAEVIDQAVVQPAIAGARIEADERDAEAAQHLRRDVAAPGHALVGFALRPVDLHRFPREKWSCGSVPHAGQPQYRTRRLSRPAIFCLHHTIKN